MYIKKYFTYMYKTPNQNDLDNVMLSVLPPVPHTDNNMSNLLSLEPKCIMLTKYDTRKNMKTFIFIFQFRLLEPRSICGNTFSFIFRRVPATKSTVNCMLYLDSTTCYKIFNRLLNFMLRPPVCYNTKHMYPNYNNYHRFIYMFNS